MMNMSAHTMVGVSSVKSNGAPRPPQCSSQKGALVSILIGHKSRRTFRQARGYDIQQFCAFHTTNQKSRNRLLKLESKSKSVQRKGGTLTTSQLEPEINDKLRKTKNRISKFG